ncbi:MAG TPA: hypothetical protein VGC39_06790, partial [Candidatus Methylacidiphilales bacterium]
MDNFSRHWAAYPRQFPSACPLVSMGEIKHKNHRIKMAFQSCNFSIILRGRGDFQRKNQVWPVEAPFVLTQWPDDPVHYGPFVPAGTWDEIYLIYDAKSLPWFRARGFADEAKPVWPIDNLEGVLAQVDELRALSSRQSLESSVDRVDRVGERLILESLLPGVKARSNSSDEIVQHIVLQFRNHPHL